ncbi:MAG: hypothetical protein HZA20_13380 [Nitrospirae bacterium]|nr:hypothetical protein [Nitrospirota bacterium]
MKTKRLILFALLLVAVTVSSGCASFPNKEIGAVDAMPDVSAYQHKPSAYIEVKFYRSEPEAVDKTEMPQATEMLTGIVKSVLDKSSLFGSYTMEPDKANGNDYQIKMYVYNHASSGAAMAAGFITGYTLGLIPSFATDNYSMVIEIYDNNMNLVEKKRTNDSVETWFGIWLVPMMSQSPNKVTGEVLENMVKHSLKIMIEGKKLRYSEITHPAIPFSDIIASEFKPFYMPERDI